MPVKIDTREYREIECRNIDKVNIETRKGESGEMIVEGYATTFNMPYELMRTKDIIVNEQVDARAFDETDMSDTIMQYDHEGRVFARVKNGTLRVEPDEHGLKVTADLGGTEIGRQLFEEINGGYTNKMSFGFTVTGEKRKRSKDEDGNTVILRTITKVGRLFDVSAVSLPANDATELSIRSIGNGLITEAQEEVRAEQERMRKIGEIRKILNQEDTDHDA